MEFSHVVHISIAPREGEHAAYSKALKGNVFLLVCNYQLQGKFRYTRGTVPISISSLCFAICPAQARPSHGIIRGQCAPLILKKRLLIIVLVIMTSEVALMSTERY